MNLRGYLTFPKNSHIEQYDTICLQMNYNMKHENIEAEPEPLVFVKPFNGVICGGSPPFPRLVNVLPLLEGLQVVGGKE